MSFDRISSGRASRSRGRRRQEDARPDLDSHYGKIGFPAVAAAACYPSIGPRPQADDPKAVRMMLQAREDSA
jgi:hypothetical protein